MTETSDPDWVEVQRFAARVEADQHALVLVSVGINCRVVPYGGAVGLFVAPPDAMRARRELTAYARENAGTGRPARPHRTRGLGDGLDGALAYCAVLMFLFSATRREALSLDWLSAGAARAGRIVGGEVWLAVTALGLHADAGHLIGNMAMGSILGLLLAQPLGTGLAWLAILVAGAAGNVLNAALQSATHAAIGASTAVFGALGILSALEWRQRTLQGRRLRRWLPIAAGATLLAFMGLGGERTDIGAHIAGFVAGGAVGAGLAHIGDRLPQGPSAQWSYGAAALILLAAAWLAALSGRG